MDRTMGRPTAVFKHMASASLCAKRGERVTSRLTKWCITTGDTGLKGSRSYDPVGAVSVVWSRIAVVQAGRQLSRAGHEVQASKGHQTHESHQLHHGW